MTDYSKLPKLPAPCHWNVLLKLLKGGDHKDAMESLRKIEVSFKAMKEALERASGKRMVEEEEVPAGDVAPVAVDGEGSDQVADVVAKVQSVLQGMEDSERGDVEGAKEACRILAIGAACDLGIEDEKRDSVVIDVCAQLTAGDEEQSDKESEVPDEEQGEACKKATHYLKKFKKAEKALKR